MKNTLILVLGLALTVALAGGQVARGQEIKLGVGMVANPGGGVKIVQVFPDTLASGKGSADGKPLLYVDDVIKTINGMAVSDPNVVRSIIQDPNTTSVTLDIEDFRGRGQTVRAEFVVIAAPPPVVTAAKGGPKVVGAAPKQKKLKSSSRVPKK